MEHTEPRPPSSPSPPDQVASLQPALYFPTLDGLRLFAFLLVFIHHLPRSSWPILGFLHDEGYVGVCIFLTLSAYLLTAILRAEHAKNGAVSKRNFYIRRALRIWPLYYLFIFTTAAYSWLRAEHSEYLAMRFAGLALFVDNIFSGIKNYNPFPFSAHLWTVALEEQFYLVLPFILPAMLSNRRNGILKLVGIWLVFVAGRSAAVVMAAPPLFIWTSVFSGDTILIGILLALVRPPSTFGRALRAACLLLGVAGIFSGAFLGTIGAPGVHQVFLYTTIAIGTGLLCMSALFDPMLSFLGARPLRYLGKISYGLYVFHFLGMAMAEKTINRFLGHSWFVNAVGSLAWTLLLAIVSYETLEKRFLRLKRRFESVRSRPL